MNPESLFPVDTLFHAAAADTAEAGLPASADHAATIDFAHLLDHLKDTKELELPILSEGHFIHVSLPQFPPITIAGVEIDLSISKHVLFLLLSALLLVVVTVSAARQNTRNPVPRGMGNLIEVFVVFIRDEIALPNMGPGGVRYLPYLLTTFFFILLMNLVGLVPFGATATSNISVTGALAVIAFVMIQLSAIRAQGLKHYLAHLTGGVHPLLWPIMVPIEVIGLFTKPFALCVRLFANMTAGHVVIVSLIGVIFLFRSYAMAPIPLILALGISMLELFVAFLQAYVFTMLTSLFMGFGMKTEHAGEEASHGH